jgi:tetratricopeptide (TPR) repeat protein
MLTGWALTNLGIEAIEAGDLAAARALQDEALCLAQEDGDRRLAMYALTNRGLVCQADGDYPAARTFHQRAWIIS